MFDRSLSEQSASWDFEEPDNGMPTQPSLEFGAELEEPGWLSLDDDKMFWGDEQPQSIASVLDTSPAAATTHSRGDKGLQQVDSSFSCGSSGDTMSRFMMFSGEDGTMSPAQPLQPSKAVLEWLAREVLVINGLPLEARATAMGAWMKKVQRYGGDVYNQVVQRSVGMLSTMRTNPLATSDQTGSGCLEAPSSSDSERSGSKRTRCDEGGPTSSSWGSFSGAASKRNRTQPAQFSSDYDSEGGHFSLGSNSHSRSSSFMISTPSTQTSRAYSSSQKFTLADMDQQLGALMSDEPMWTDAPAGIAADPFSVANLSIPSNSSSKMEGLSWDSPGLHIDVVGPGEDLPPIFMQALYTMCNDGGPLVDL